jgi:hypothetical protein
MGVLTPKRAVLFVVAVLLGTAVSAGNPSPRTQSKMAWDTSRNVGVLFGGIGPVDQATGPRQHESAETWLWNGSVWVQRFPATTPPERAFHGMTFDSARSRVVMFGGRQSPVERDDPPTYLNDTWVYQNDDWTRIESVENPEPRQVPAMAYDRARGRVMLYGGNRLAADQTSFTTLEDTWEFDGTQWKKIAEGPKIAKPVMAYDATRNEMLLLGLNEAGTERVMYKYDVQGKAWVSPSPVPAALPTCVNDGFMVYRDNPGRVIFFGGVCSTIAGTPAAEEVFEWDGSTWTKLTVLAPPPRLAGEAVAYDPVRRQVVTYGGTTAFGSVVGSQTQIFANDTWQVTGYIHRPRPRSQAGFETDAATNTIWLFGGLDETSSAYHTDLWGYRNGQWFRSVLGPASCNSPLTAFDSDRGRLVVNCTGEETYEWDGTAWKNFASLADKPDARSFAAIAYDPTLKRTVMFGGYFGNNFRNDTWTWNGTAWTEVETDRDERPPNRAQMAMWYDPLLKKVVLYGGIGRGSLNERVTRYSDMWAFNGTGWAKLDVAQTPGMRFGPQVEVNPLTGKALLFGGLVAEVRSDDPKGEALRQFFANDTWEWDGAASRWTRLSTDAISPDPGVRENHSMAWDPVASQMVLFGGYADGFYRSDVWVWNGQDWAPRLDILQRRRAAR